jgi:hypothetical protein
MVVVCICSSLSGGHHEQALRGVVLTERHPDSDDQFARFQRGDRDGCAVVSEDVLPVGIPG